MPKILLVEDNEMNRDMLSRRLVRNAFLAAVTILVLILAIVVIWRLPSLPGFSSGPPAIFSPR